MTSFPAGQWRLHTGKVNEGGNIRSGNDFRERIDRILDGANDEDLKAIYCFLLGRIGIALDSDCRRKE